jgi:hypothetical protein
MKQKINETILNNNKNEIPIDAEVVFFFQIVECSDCKLYWNVERLKSF